MKKNSKTLSGFARGISKACPLLKLLTRRSSSRSSSFTEESEGEAISESGSDDHGMMLRSKSHDYMEEVDTCFKNYNDLVDNLARECPQTDLYQDHELYNLLVDFFNTTPHASELCEPLRHNLEKKVQYGDTSVDNTSRDFKEERRISGDDGSFRKTLEDLKSLQEYSKEDLSGHHIDEFRSCHRKLDALARRLSTTMKKLHRRKNTIRIASIAMGTFRTLLAVTVGMVVGPIVVGSIAGSNVPIDSATSGLPWSRDYLKRRLDDLQMKWEAINSMKSETITSLRKVAKIMALVNKCTRHFKSIAETAQTAVERKLPIHMAIVDVEEKKEQLKNSAGELDTEMKNFQRDMQSGLKKTYETIKQYLIKGKTKQMPKILVTVELQVPSRNSLDSLFRDDN